MCETVASMSEVEVSGGVHVSVCPWVCLSVRAPFFRIVVAIIATSANTTTTPTTPPTTTSTTTTTLILRLRACVCCAPPFAVLRSARLREINKNIKN